MLKSHWRTVSKIERLADNAVVIAVFFLTYLLRDPLLVVANHYGLSVARSLRELAPIQDYFVILGFSIPLFNAALNVLGAYRSMRLTSAFQLLRTCFFASALVFLALGALLFILKLDLSRSFVGLFCALAGITLFVERQVVLAFLRFFRARGKNFRNVLVVGCGQAALELYCEIVSKPELGIRVVGFCSLGGEKLTGLPAPVIADTSTFEIALKRFAIDDVLFSEVSKHFAEIEELAQIAAEEGVGVSLAADFFSLEILKSDVSYFGSIPLIHYQQFAGDGTGLLVKRGFDILVSGVLLVAILPFMLLLAVLIRLDSRGPVFFRQERVGLNGRLFTLLKFRSMVQDAESQIGHLQKYNEMQGPVFKMSNDPRITGVGHFLRKYSLDELPQLWNVFKGDMSLVGPRPPLASEVSLYRRTQRRRLSMRPGITCTWQVSGRNDIPSFEEWARMDLDYIDNWSLKRDLVLLLRTIPAVFTGSGAR